MSVSYSSSGAATAGPATGSAAFIIEIGGAAAGIVAADGARFRFHAAGPRFQPLDGQIFRTPGDAERAARRVINSRQPVRGHAAPAREARR